MNNDKEALGQYRKVWLKRLSTIVCLVFVMVGLGSSAFAATTRTVAIHPSGSTPPSGYDATYTSMFDMEAAENADLVALDRFLKVEIVNSDSDWSTADISAVTFDGWNCDRSAGQYVVIEVMSGARNPYTDGKWSTSHYRLSASSGTLLIDNDAAAGNYFEADFIGLQVESTAGSVAGRVKDGAYHKVIKFKGCHFRNTTAFEVFQLSDDGTAEVWLINCILENPTNGDEILRATSAWQTAGTATAYFYNCTVVGGGNEGLDVAGGTITVKNCAVFNNNNTDVSQSGATVDYVASDDSVGTNWVDISPGAEIDGWNAAVTDYANGDYRVKDTSSVLHQAGLSQSLDGNVPLGDIAGNTRPSGSNPVSIGAFEGSSCATKNLLMVVGNTTLPADDQTKKTLFESWGWTVNLLDHGTADYSIEAANNDVMFISESTGSGTVGTKATNLDIGIVVEEDYLWDEMEFGSPGDGGVSHDTINITDNSHYITSPFSTGNLQIYSAGYDNMGSLGSPSPTLASGGQSLANENAGSSPTLFVFDTGASLVSGTATNRRVGFPTKTSNPDNWNADLKILLQRSLDWAAGCYDASSSACGTNLVMVVGTDTSQPYDAPKQTLFESWGWTVSTINDTDSQTVFNNAAASNDVMYISESTSSGNVGTKARDLNIGIVDDECWVWDSMEYGSTGDGNGYWGTYINITDNSHYITSPFSTGNLTVYTTDGNLNNLPSSLASGGQLLGQTPASEPTLFAFDSGADLDAGTAANRRVGFSSFDSDPAIWTANFETLLQRSLNWAAGCGAGTGGTNLVPAAVDDSFTTDEDVNLDENVLTNDTLGDAPNTVSEVSGVSNGLLTLNADGSFTYDPDVGFSGTDSFTYRLTDADSETSDATVTITVNAAGSPAPNLDEYSCNMKITVNSAQVAADLNNFPVLIHITDDSLTTSSCGFMTDSTGDDLIFTNSSKTIQLDHEIEKYDNTTGELVAWVEVPFLSASSDTDIYMYYGNSNVTTPQENPTGVWESNYEGVWHLKEDAATATTTTLEVSVATQDDDAEELISSGAIDLSSSDLELVRESGDQEIGMRFLGVTIPPGAAITNAYVEFAVDETDSETTNLTFWGEDADNPGTFTSTTYDITSRTKTSASVDWNNIAAWDTVGQLKQTPNLKTIIQEIVDRPGWASGNAMVIIVTGTGKRVADSYSGTAPMLHVEYSTEGDFHFDSTSNANHGTPNGNTLTESGKIDGAQDFDGVDNYVEVPHADSYLLDDGTVSFWFKASDVTTQQGLWSKDSSGLDTGGHLSFFIQTDSTIRVRFQSTTASNNAYSNAISANTWYLLSYTFGSGGMNLYLNDGTPATNGYTGGLGTTSGGAGNYEPIAIGGSTMTSGDFTVAPVTDLFTGSIDEVRISNVARSADWITTEYNNQNDPSSFYSVEKNCPSNIPPITEFSCNIPITINSSKVSGTSDLIDFPVLISLTNASLKTTGNCGYVQNSSGYDIIFSDATQTILLDHEIEKYDGASGELVAWVRVPTLSATSDTTIYIHFGHSNTCGATENPAGVWDNNYMGVWHLDETVSNEGTGGTHYDSTSNSNDGTQYENDEEPGQIADGQQFDGVNDYINIPNKNSLNPDYLTIEFWVNFSSWVTNGGVLAKGDDTYRQYWIWTYDGAVSFEIDEGGHQNYAWSPTGGQWEHLTLTYDGTSVVTYTNGVQENTYAQATGSINSTTEPLLFGEIPGYNFINGFIDEVKISNTVRSADWLKTEYNNQSDPSSFYTVGLSSCFLSGFSCNRKITIDSTKVEGSSDLINFPFLIRVQNDCNLKTAANGGGVQNSNGWDIIFVDSDGITQLDHEIEEYDGATGDLTAWVRIPTLPYNSDKDIYMYYGNSDLTCDPSNPTGVWDNNYVAVWHLQDQTNIEDSTSYSNDGTPYNVDDASGIIGIGQDFDGNDYIQVPESSSLDITGDEITLSAWVKMTSSQNDDASIINKSYSNNYNYLLNVQGTDQANFRVKTPTGTTYLTGSTILAVDQWYFIYGIYNGSTAKVYVNNSEDGTDNRTGNIESSSPAPVNLGRRRTYPTADNRYFDGVIDEARISNVARSVDWMKTEYNNQNDPDSFYSMSQDTCGGAYGFNFQYCKKIVVDHTQVDSDLTSFPLLVNLANDDDLKTVANGGRVQNSQGWDIVFRTSGCGNLDHEIEKYDGSAGDLVAWVNVPTLSSSSDTEIYMYYGANVVCNFENPTAVWNSDYEAVYHLHDDFKDSTSNSRDGVNNGAALTTGSIANAASFDPSDGYDYVDLGTWNVSGSSITMQAWVEADTFTQDDPRIVSKCSSSGSGTQEHVFQLVLNNGPTVENEMRIRIKTGTDDLSGTTNLYGTDPNGLVPDNQWHFLAGTYDGSNMQMYRDDGLDAGSTAKTGSLRQNSWSIWAGANPHGSSNTVKSWDGMIDELRILSVARSVDWLKTEYRNQSNPGNFYTVTSCFEQTTEMTQEWVEEIQ